MSGELVNLRLARKRRDRLAKEAVADRNRFEHGRSKAERELARARNDKATRDLDASRREPGTSDSAADRDSDN
ncbi:MAG: DUF4169 family protein [Hoeflea sp.]|uniref:DUF4169 family protein n=1 Tax=Hoeflea sp. TaxID=1940281 RepID=UPI0027322099|nr:DUF4169 family protein [Hoeflea sp.]MDP2121346.1 DUF4169 family protein [Hoeflea sp.]MDP3524666.1 DUF4169 family protein [Hoeflea sp.]